MPNDGSDGFFHDLLLDYPAVAVIFASGAIFAGGYQAFRHGNRGSAIAAWFLAFLIVGVSALDALIRRAWPEVFILGFVVTVEALFVIRQLLSAL
jgi:hypothetical protein